MPSLTFVVSGAPRTKKTHNRVVRAGHRLVVLPSSAWCAWRDAALPALRQFAQVRGTVTWPVNCCATFYRDAARGDAVGYYQGLADVLQEGGIVDDDVRLVSWDGSRLKKDAANPRTVVVLSWQG